MPPIAKPKENRITKLAKAVKARSPLPSFVNDAILPTDVPTDVAGLMPMGTEIQAGASMLSPLISIYKDKAAREAATQEFINSVRNFAHNPDLPQVVRNAWTSAGDAFAARYPRIAAHTRQNPELTAYEIGGMHAGASLGPAGGKVTKPLDLNLHPAGVDEIARDPNSAYDLMFHEGTHVAQSLGNKDADEIYQLSSALAPYRYIPHEHTARIGGQKGRFNVPTKPRTAEEKVKQSLMKIYASPAADRYTESDIEFLFDHNKVTGNWPETARTLTPIESKKMPNSGKALRQLTEIGFGAPADSEVRRAATRLTKILNRRESTPMAPTREQLTQMSPFARLAMKLNLK